MTQKARAVLLLFPFSAAAQGDTEPVPTCRGQALSVPPRAGVTLSKSCLRHVRHWQWEQRTVGTPVRGLLTIPLALSPQLIIHTPLMSGMHLWDIYQGLSHHLWPQNKVNLADPHGTRAEPWPLGPTGQTGDQSPQNLLHCWGEQLVVRASSV